MSGPCGPKSNTICALPWLHRFTNLGGENQVCCTSEERDNNIRHSNGRRMTAPETFNGETIMNSEYMKTVRRQMLNGEWPELCHRCKVTEAAGGASRRVVENRAYQADLEGLLKTTAADGTVENLQVRSMDLRLGNLCNLACRMCHPRASTSWHREWPKVDQNLFVIDAESIRKNFKYDWYKSPQVMVEFKSQLPDLRHVHFAGGEPLIVPEMIGFLEACVDGDYAKNIEVSYNTNLTVIPEKAKKLWPKFRRVKLLCSVDGFGPVNDLIRHPSKWGTLDRNLRDVDTHFAEYGISEVMIACTVQAYNIFRLDELYDYMALNLKNAIQLPVLIDLHYPNYYQTQILPASLKKSAEARLLKILEVSRGRIDSGLIPKSQEYLLEHIRSSLNFMNMENQENLIPAFLRAARSKDAFRNQSFTSVIPELSPLDTLDAGFAAPAPP